MSMSSPIVLSSEPFRGAPSSSTTTEKDDDDISNISCRVFGDVLACRSTSDLVGEAVDMTASSSTIFASQIKETIYQPLASTSKPPPSSFSLLGAIPVDAGSGSFDDDGSTTIAALDSPTPSPRALPFSSPIPRTKKSDLLARRSNTPSLWLHEAILRNGLQASISAFSSPATSIRTSASLSNDNLSLGNSSGSDSESGSSNAHEHVQMMRILVDEAAVLKNARQLAEQERDKAVEEREKVLRDRAMFEAALKRLRTERGEWKKKYEKAEKRLGDQKKCYKTRKAQFHGARTLHQQALKQVDAVRNVSVAWQNALDAEIALSKRLRLELRSKDEEIERFNKVIDDLNSKLEVVIRERDALASECGAFSAERDIWIEERAQFSSEKSLLLQERDSWATERDSLLQEKDSWSKERDAFSTERDTLLNERESLQDLIKQLIGESKSAALDLSIAKDKANLLTDQNSSLRDKNSALRLQVDRLETSVVTYKEETKSYQASILQLEKRKESLKKDIIELQEYEKEIIEAHNEEREKRRYWRGMFEKETKRCEELKERFETREAELEKVINSLREEMDDCRTQLALMEDWAGEMEDERRILNEQIEAWKNGAAYEDLRADVEAYDAEEFSGEDSQQEQDAEVECVEDVIIDENARDDGITPGDVKVAGDDSDPVNEDMDLEGLDLEEFEERVIAVNDAGEIEDRHDASPSPIRPSERPVDPSMSRLFEELDGDNSLNTSQYRKYERIPEYHRAMEDLRHQRAKLDDYRVKLLEWKDELKKEQARYDEISQDLFERERDFYATVDQRDHHMAKLADEYDRWRTECEFKEAEVEEERLAVWRHQREVERKIERVKERERMCRKREGEVRWRMMCLDGALANAEPGCWRCVSAPVHLFPPTPQIDYRDLDRHFEDLNEGQHESQLRWAEERNRRLREERDARLKENVDEEYLHEEDNEAFEFSGPEAIKQYLREEHRHQKNKREDERVDDEDEMEMEEWKLHKEENDKRVREAVEELMKEADEVKRLERKEREKAECGDDGIVGTYDEDLAVHDGLKGLGLAFEPIASTLNNDFAPLPPLPPSPAAGSSSLELDDADTSSEHALFNLADPLSRRALIDSMESTMRDTYMVDHAEPTSREVEEEEEEEERRVSSTGMQVSNNNDNNEGSLMTEEMPGAEDLSASWEDVSAE